jgi:hypothetical protein
MKKNFLLILLLALTFISCEKHRLNKLRGGWLVVAPAATPSHQLKYFHHITFDCDEFRLQRQVLITPRCDTTDTHEEYIKGTYKLDGKTVSLEGTYMDANYQQVKTSGCGTKGSYVKKFSWEIEDDLLVLKEEGKEEEKFSSVTDLDCD